VWGLRFDAQDKIRHADETSSGLNRQQLAGRSYVVAQIRKRASKGPDPAGNWGGESFHGDKSKKFPFDVRQPLYGFLPPPLSRAALTRRIVSLLPHDKTAFRHSAYYADRHLYLVSNLPCPIPGIKETIQD
jgi:hypothetical protein